MAAPPALWPNPQHHIALFSAPPPGRFKPWYASLVKWREDTLRAIGGTDASVGEVYKVESLRWTQTSYVQPQVHTWDRFLWNETAQAYSVDRYLDDCRARFGGIDSVLVWPTYPNLGADERNQFDLLRLSDLADLVRRFHARGVAVLLPYNPWDVATRPEGRPDPTALAALAAELGADGFNGDTMHRVGRQFWSASAAAGRPLAIEPEGGAYADWPGPNASFQWASTNWCALASRPRLSPPPAPASPPSDRPHASPPPATASRPRRHRLAPCRPGRRSAGATGAPARRR